MIEWSLDAFRACDSVRSIVVAAPPSHAGDLVGHADLGVVCGGDTRAQSVANCLEAVGTELVAIHDAARPLLTPEIVRACLEGLDEGADAAIAAARVTDTIKEGRAADPFTVDRTVDRSKLWAIQTPQVFRRDVLERALAQPEHLLASATDDAALVEGMGGAVRLVESPRDNLKVTTPDDLRLAELLLRSRHPATD